jgi:predicted dehydrogenase
MSSQEPVRVGVAGLSHDHVFELFREMQNPHSDIQVVGIAEPDATLAQEYAARFQIDPALLFTRLDDMLDTARPAAVMAYGSIYDHRAVVEACAPRGVHVMVEKPLAVSAEHAQAMADLARRHAIHLLTNYETSWYASLYAARERVCGQGLVGEIRKVVVHDGHFGPRELGCSEAFLAWLTDPVLNGGGAIIDFGCYGANLITWLMNGEEPLAVTAVTQTIKPEVYPRVDDEATIVLTYPRAQGIIQASWNWPVDRKDIEIYGQTGYVHAPNRSRLLIRTGRGPKHPEELLYIEPNAAPLSSPFAYLAAVARGELAVTSTDLSSLENNLSVVRILDAARASAQTGQKIRL